MDSNDAWDILNTPQGKQAVNLSSCPKKNEEKKKKAALFEVAWRADMVDTQPHGWEGGSFENSKETQSVRESELTAGVEEEKDKLPSVLVIQKNR